jgi:NTP pyrophosphatase (non-canonical NTP hydrolase)
VTTMARIELPERPTMADYQRYIHELEAMHGWLDVDLIHNGFLLAEELGELIKAIRKHEKYFSKDHPEGQQAARDHVAEEIVDCFNYLCAIANRLEIDLDAAFRKKNERNQNRTWEPAKPKADPEG